jgi:hypothetical protein
MFLVKTELIATILSHKTCTSNMAVLYIFESGVFSLEDSEGTVGLHL